MTGENLREVRWSMSRLAALAIIGLGPQLLAAQGVVTGVVTGRVMARAFSALRATAGSSSRS